MVSHATVSCFIVWFFVGLCTGPKKRKPQPSYH